MTGAGRSDELEDLVAQLDGTFLRELGGRLAAMRAALAILEARPSDAARSATLRELTRHAHSVKGGALLVRRQEIARLAGALEARFARHEAGATARPIPQVAAEALLAIDRLSTADQPGSEARDHELGGTPLRPEIESLIEALEELLD